MNKVNLKDVIKAMEVMNSDIVILFDKDKSRFLYIPKIYQDQVDIYLSQKNMIAFLSIEDIPFIQIREQFIETLSGSMKIEFQKQFSGKYRFKQFKDTLTKYHQWEEFNGFQNEKYTQIARIWCEKNHISYI